MHIHIKQATASDDIVPMEKIGSVQVSYSSLKLLFDEPTSQADELPQWYLDITYMGDITGQVIIHAPSHDELDTITRWDVSGKTKFNLYDLEEYITLQCSNLDYNRI
tara:strand:- start:10879 stop:11199 length:321 start_codon:yes stop_codon:yes gene_type:complete